MNRWLYGRDQYGPIICQISGRWDQQRRTNLPAQCCGLPADQIYKCEQIAGPGHRCQVGDHTILHERMGNGASCTAVEVWLTERGGLSGWVNRNAPKYTVVGP